GPKSLSTLAQGAGISLPLATKHVAVLERAGLVHSSKDGRVRTCRFDPGPLQEAGDWIRKYETYWEAGLDRLAAMLEAEMEGNEDGSNG
ncbi:MAG TPA: helix-turn-helix transcriptional regulator, partial [Fimbriimonadaceae bacterium]|nr:helix-turn-helix transcriptional regulator [Fimbriimonadaceae bacterium]